MVASVIWSEDCWLNQKNLLQTVLDYVEHVRTSTDNLARTLLGEHKLSTTFLCRSSNKQSVEE